MAMVAVVVLCLQPSWGIVGSRWGSREKVDPYYYTLVFSWPEAVLSPLSMRSHIPYPPQAATGHSQRDDTAKAQGGWGKNQ